MAPEKLAQSIWQQFDTALSQPVPTLTLTVVIGSILWWLIRREFQTRLDNAQSTINLKEHQLQDYREKLSGATPDEAKARINALEADVARLKPRRLTDGQKQTIRDNLNAKRTGRIRFEADRACWDAEGLAEDLRAVFESVGWQAKVEMVANDRLGRNQTGFLLQEGHSPTHEELRKIVAEAICAVFGAIAVARWGLVSGDEVCLLITHRPYHL